MPESVRFDDHTPLDLPSIELEETVGQSFAAGGSDYDSDMGSPAPKHIVLRNTKHKSPYLKLRKPKLGEFPFFFPSLLNS